MEPGRIIAVLLVAVVCLAFSTPTHTQQTTEESLALHIQPGAAQSGSIRTFTVNPEFETPNLPRDARFGEPSKIPESFLMLMAGTGGWQRDLEVTPEQYLDDLLESGQRYVLSAETLNIKDKAWLILNNASNVNPEQGIIFDASARGSLTINLFVEGNHKYYVQFFLQPLGPGLFELNVGSDQQQFQDPTGKLTNIFVPLRVLSSGWTQIELKRTFGVGFILHSIDLIFTEVGP